MNEDTATGASEELAADLEALIDRVALWIAESERTLVFTGAGVSTESGIPDFRGPQGLWKRVDPKLFTIQNYVADPEIRRQSWARRLEGELFSADPNPSHRAIARLEALGRAPVVVTQNIDALHQAAGSGDVIELHGTVREVTCLDCGDRGPVEDTVTRVRAGEDDPECLLCGGILKVATISFGQQLEPDVIERAFAEAERADLCISAGSSLSVTPAAYIPARVAERGKPLAIINEEPTELDSIAAARIAGKTGAVLPRLAERVAELLSSSNT